MVRALRRSVGNYQAVFSLASWVKYLPCREGLTGRHPLLAACYLWREHNAFNRRRCLQSVIFG
jgi:hypothetical protein